MSHATNVDFIGPKNSNTVTIHGASIAPQVTEFSADVSGASAPLTITGTVYSFGHIVVFQFNQMTFTGTDSVLRFNISGLGIPLPISGYDFHCPYINLQGAGVRVGEIQFSSTGDVSLLYEPNTVFPSGVVATVLSTVVYYVST